MKTRIFAFVVALTAGFVFAQTYGGVPPGRNSSQPFCSVPVATAAPTTTIVAEDGGSCYLTAGQTVMVQCDVAVYLRPGDGGTATTINRLNGWLADFASNKDPVEVPLGPGDRHITVQASSASGTCQFGPAWRRKAN